MEHYSYMDFFQYACGKRGGKYAFCAENEEDFLRWKGTLRQAVSEKLGLPVITELAGPEGAAGAGRRVRELETVREDGYLRKKMVMETLPEVSMPFYVLIPDTLKGGEQYAAMLAFPAHGANKDTVARVVTGEEVRRKVENTPAECYGREFVKRGYVVFCPDPPGFGERREALPAEDAAFAPEAGVNPLDSSCKNLALTSQALGFSLTGLMLWDMQRLLDYAEGLDYVDAERIGCVGFSGGGQASMWLAAMDDRISLAVISGYLHSYTESMLHSHLCCCNYFPGLWELADVSDICSMIAPRPLFLENGNEDVENGPRGIAGPVGQAEKIRRAYMVFHAGDNLRQEIKTGGHAWYGSCYDFVECKMKC